MTLALRSLKKQWASFLIIAVQIAVCFAVTAYTLSSVFQQYDIVLSANGAHKGYLYLNSDPNKLDEILVSDENSGRPDFESVKEEYFAKNNITDPSTLTEQQWDEFYAFFYEKDAEYMEKVHYKGKYLYEDLFAALNDSGCISEIHYNAALGISTVLIDEYLLKNVRLSNADISPLFEPTEDENHYYALMYPWMTDENAPSADSPPYKVGDIITERTYNLKEHRYDTFTIEIVGELDDPAYAFPMNEFSATKAELEGFFLSPQSISVSGMLIALKKDSFNYMDYMNGRPSYIMAKLADGITDEQYDKLLSVIDECGFAAVDLDEAEENTIAKITAFVSENSVILISSLLLTVFSVVAVSILSGSKTRREYAVYKLCGMSRAGLTRLTAVKWLIIFTAAVTVGSLLAAAYLNIIGEKLSYLLYGAIAAAVMFAVLYALSLLMSYYSSVRSLKAYESGEWEGDL